MRLNGKGLFLFKLAAILFCLIFGKFYLIDHCSSIIAKDKGSVNQFSPVSEGNEIDWRKKSTEAAQLVFYRKYAQANAIFVKILPIARKEDPNGLDLGILLARYGFGLLGEKKYQQSLASLEEALKIVQKRPTSKRQTKAMFQILKGMSTVYILLNQFSKGEDFARKAIAYRIAFPETSSLNYYRDTYEGLRFSLENQKKSDEAEIIAEIIKTLS